MKRKGSIAKIAGKFPQPGTVKEIQGGFNYIHLGQTYSFYYNGQTTKANRMVHNGNVFLFLSGSEAECLKTALESQSASSGSVNLANPKVMEQPRGAQACIDHVQRKLDKIKTDPHRRNDSGAVVLISLIEELKQYL